MKKLPRKEYPCLACGMVVIKLESQASKSTFCSRACYWSDKKGKAPHNKGKVIRVSKPCNFCGAEMTGIASEIARRNYCSQACAGKGNRSIVPRVRSAAHWSDDLESAKDYIRSKVNILANGCWQWTGSLNGGYGRPRINGKSMYAHRFAYEAYKGQIQDGLFLDHLCRNRACLNPDHLEPVTLAENIRRGEAGGEKWSDERKASHSANMRKRFENPERKKRQLEILHNARTSDACRAGKQVAFRQPAYREAMSRRITEWWAKRKEAMKNDDC